MVDKRALDFLNSLDAKDRRVTQKERWGHPYSDTLGLSI